jgi:Flp pilus assembly pilin Flp
MERHRHPRRSERGATLVEYTLLVAVLALGSLAGLDALQSSAAAAFREQASEMSDPPAGGASGTPTTAAPTTAAPTTAPPTTAAPVTTTTVRPTTTTSTTTTSTTSTTTTTVPRATTATGSWGATSATRDGSRWTASATLTVTDDLRQSVRGAAVTVRVEYRVDGGSWQTGQPVSGSTGSSGTLQITTADLARSGRSPITSIRYTVLTVDAAGLRWVGGSPSTTLSAP